MDDLYMYSRQDSLTPTGYTAMETRQDVRVRRSISETSPEAALPPEPLYRCMAPGPVGFIRRGELDGLIEALRTGAASESPIALVGPEGFGKTALAQAACWDPRVRSAFPDGILWAAFSEGLEAYGRLARLREIIRWWTRSEPPAFATEAAAGAHLSLLLAGRRVLLVIDGAASAMDMTSFAGLPAGVTLLATARDRAVLPADAMEVAIGSMATPEAVELLRANLPRAFEGTFQALARRLGNWPLLLAIVNRQIREWNVRDRSALESALREVVRALDIVGLDAGFDREDPLARRSAVWRAVAIALRSLVGSDRDRLLDLAVFPAEEDIPLAVVRSLWGLGAVEVRKLGKRLRDLSLVSLDPWAGTLRLHAVVAGFLLGRRRGELSLLHGRLLDACRPASGRWADLPTGEAYLWRRLAGHLLAAGRSEEFRETLLDLSFLRAKLEATDIHSLIADFGLGTGKDGDLSLVREALRLSAGALAGDTAQLAPQLLGRLLDRRERALQTLLNAARGWRETAWLKPQTASFVRPGAAASQDAGAEAPATPRSKAPMAVYGFLAVSADGPALRLWDLETSETLNSLEGHTAGVTALALVGARHVLSGARDKTLRLWDLSTGRALRTFEGHKDWISALAVVDANRALSGACDGTVRLWDLETGETLRTFEGHRHGITALALPDAHRVLTAQRVLSASQDGTLRLWNLETGKSLRTLTGHTGWITALAILSAHRAVSAALDGTLRLWDLDRGEPLAVLHLDAPVRTLTAGPDGRTVSAADDAGRTHLLELVEPE
ncbi:MAG TPA: NB-ARC domain-containing protein [Thermoanaerobaculia bacterium]|nr:NB-ARC domain-containing protein [Thermoanaerobaculia bacterium]